MPPRPINFLPPPYTYVANIDVSQGNWTRPSNVIVCEIRCVSDEIDLVFRLRVNTQTENRVILKGLGENIWRLMIDRIHQHGTDIAVRNNCIEVYGYYRDTMEQYMGA